MVKFQPSTLAMWVRFPLPALKTRSNLKIYNYTAAYEHWTSLPFCKPSRLLVATRNCFRTHGAG